MAGKRQAARDERRARLVAAAQRVFGEKGYHGATVDDLTRTAGVAKGTFYLYFDEKRDLFYEVIQGFFQLILEIAGSVRRTPRAALDFVAEAERAAGELMRVFLENRELARLAHRESMGLDAELEKMVQGFYRELADLEAKNIRLGIELGLVRDDVDPLLVGYAHIGMVERALLQLLDDPKSLPPPDEFVRQMVRLAFQGLVRS